MHALHSCTLLRAARWADPGAWTLGPCQTALITRVLWTSATRSENHLLLATITQCWPSQCRFSALKFIRVKTRPSCRTEVHAWIMLKLQLFFGLHLQARSISVCLSKLTSFLSVPEALFWIRYLITPRSNTFDTQSRWNHQFLFWQKKSDSIDHHPDHTTDWNMQICLDLKLDQFVPQSWKKQALFLSPFSCKTFQEIYSTLKRLSYLKISKFNP